MIWLVVVIPSAMLGLGLFLGAMIHASNPVHETPFPAKPAGELRYYRRVNVKV